MVLADSLEFVLRELRLLVAYSDSEASDSSHAGKLWISVLPLTAVVSAYTFFPACSCVSSTKHYRGFGI